MDPVETVGHGAESVTKDWENPDKLPDNIGAVAPDVGESALGSPMAAGDLLLIVSSPKAGAGDGSGRIAKLKDRVGAAGLEVVQESNITVVEKRVRQEQDAGRRLCVAAAGGDGTLNLLASVLGSEVPLMPFPLGTENLVARHYGLMGPNGEFDINVAVSAVLNGANRVVDAGVATFLKRNGSRRNKLFLIMASVGFDAEVVRRMHLTRKGHINLWSYLKPIVAVLRRYRYPRIEVEQLDRQPEAVVEKAAELQSERFKVAWALLFNMPRYAAGLSIESLADETDGALDFCGLSYGSHFHGLRYLFGVLSGQHTRWADVKRFRGASFRLSSGKPVAVQLDGDYAGRLPMEVRVESKRVTLRLPASCMKL